MRVFGGCFKVGILLKVLDFIICVLNVVVLSEVEFMNCNRNWK